MRYPPYLESAICTQCGWPGVGSTFEAQTLPDWRGFSIPHPRRILRTCTRCQCAWYERPIGYLQSDEDQWWEQCQAGFAELDRLAAERKSRRK